MAAAVPAVEPGELEHYATLQALSPAIMAAAVPAV